MSDKQISLDEKCLNIAAGTFLCELPASWSDLDDQEQDEFVADNLWEPFQYWETKDMWEHISNLKYDVESLLKQTLNLDSLELNTKEPYFLVAIDIRYGEYVETVKSLVQHIDQEMATIHAIESLSRSTLDWQNEGTLAFDCCGDIALTLNSVVTVAPEHVGILELYNL